MARIYEDASVFVEHHEGAPESLFITFSAWRAQPPRIALWADEIANAGLSGVFVVAKDNHWYSYDGIWECLEAVAAVRAKYERVTILGSSMGAFAALRFSKEMSADVVIAVSPQVSPYTDVIGSFDQRWMADADRLSYRLSDLDRDCTSGASFVLFDPKHWIDRMHAERIRAATDAELIAFPYSGHPTGFALYDTGLIGCLFTGQGYAATARQSLLRALDAYMSVSDRCATSIINKARVLGDDAKRKYLAEVAQRRSDVQATGFTAKKLDDLIAATLEPLCVFDQR